MNVVDEERLSLEFLVQGEDLLFHIANGEERRRRNEEGEDHGGCNLPCRQDTDVDSRDLDCYRRCLMTAQHLFHRMDCIHMDHRVFRQPHRYCFREEVFWRMMDRKPHWNLHRARRMAANRCCDDVDVDGAAVEGHHENSHVDHNTLEQPSDVVVADHHWNHRNESDDWDDDALEDPFHSDFDHPVVDHPHRRMMVDNDYYLNLHPRFQTLLHCDSTTWLQRRQPPRPQMDLLETWAEDSKRKILLAQTTIALPVAAAVVAAVAVAVILPKVSLMVDDSWSYWKENDCAFVHHVDSWQ
jgi:hypothetical protein